ncbi:MAG TPA: tetratricopeptide repeat protein, partial [Chloroflexi bacterium]|nr:tetratricopeptide repeat protein [Chloroflexota bacterium]
MSSEREHILTESELTATLRGYLPSSLERQCLLGDQIRATVPCTRHLTALLRAISTYLPRQVVTPLIAHPELGKVEGHFAYGTVMFADISGFTAMSEKLSLLGKEGAEEITRIINHLFTALLEVTDQHGGDLLKFGGDALLVYFGGENHVLRACLAALRMQSNMARFSETETSQGVFRLQMTIGLGTGPLFMARLGSEESMEFAVMGRGLAQMAQAEDYASAGQIFVDAETFQPVAAQAEVGNTQDGFYQLLDLHAVPELDLDHAQANPLASLPPPPSDGDARPWIADTLQRIRALELFMPPGLMDKIKLEPERIAIGGEYRPVTVFFANFYGIDEIIETLGEARSAEITAILNAHFKTMRQIIAKYGGVVNKVDTYAVGHRIMTLFGAPRAHIDDPERATRAALEMQEAMVAFNELNTSCGQFCLKQRIGVNTGLVFAGNVGSLTRQEYSVMGDGVNLAARLMAVATEGQVIISQSTARQSGGAFLLHEQEPVKVKGKSLPVHNYHVLGLQEKRAREHRPLIGRDQEWETIHPLIDRSLTGETRVLTIVGDAGLGKSRLLDEIAAHWAEEHGALSIGTACPSFGRHTPYLPWLDLLRALFGFNPADPDPIKLEKIGALLIEIDPTWRDWTALIGRLLGLEMQETDLMQALDAQTRQRITFLIVTGLVNHISGEQPLLLSIDDLQWADDISIELINHVTHQISDQPLLVAVAHRPDEIVDSSFKVADLPLHTDLRLHELSDQSSLELLDTLLPTTPAMPPQLKRLILKNAQGNPLFIEEVAHSLIENYLTLDEESGTYRARADLEAEEIEIPDSVNRVIMSRIDRLDESSRNVLKVASVIGQEFEHWLLSAVYPYRQAEGELREHLDELSQREILEGPYPDLLYLFRHIMTREVAYESMLYADRRRLHRRIGESIEIQQAGRLTEYVEVLAYHFGLAEEWDKSLHYHLEAGHKAQAIYANEDAIHHFRQALKAAERVEWSEGYQLTAHEKLGEVLDTLGEYDEALAHIYRAQDLVMAMDDFSPEEQARRLADLCRRTATIHEKRSDYDAALDSLRGGLLALEGMDAVEAARIYLLGAGVYRRQGRNEEAIEWCQKSLHIALQVKTRESQQVVAHAYYNLGGIYTRQGDLLRGVEYCLESLHVYQQIDDIVGQSQAHINLANAYFEQGNWPKANEHYLQALEIKRKIGDVYYQGFITVNLGGVYLKQGYLDQADNYYQQSLSMWQELGSTYVIALLHNNMGAVALQRDDWDQALALLQQSLDMFQQIGSEDYLAEVYRQIAQAHLGRQEYGDALDHAQRSLALAQQHEMRLEEGITRRVLGQIYLALGDLSQTEQELVTSL